MACVDCGRWVLYRASVPMDARCERCWRAFTGATYDGTPHGRITPVPHRLKATP